MFTGLVQDCGIVGAVNQTKSGMKLTVQTKLPKEDLSIGASVACNGVCLTVTQREKIDSKRSSVLFDVGPETIAKSGFALRKVGDKVNLEPALRQGDPLGGHSVLGHVDGLAQVLSFEKSGECWNLLLKLKAQHLEWVVPQGSIAVQGVSLTIASLDQIDGTIGIMVIPHTLEKTNLHLFL